MTQKELDKYFPLDVKPLSYEVIYFGKKIKLTGLALLASFESKPIIHFTCFN